MYSPLLGVLAGVIPVDSWEIPLSQILPDSKMPPLSSSHFQSSPQPHQPDRSYSFHPQSAPKISSISPYQGDLGAIPFTLFEISHNEAIYSMESIVRTVYLR